MKHYRTQGGTFIGSFSDDIPVADGIEVPAPPATIEAAWDTATNTWAYPVPKKALRGLINTLRDYERSFVTWGGDTFDASPTAIVNITGRVVAYGIAERVEPSYWISATGNAVPFIKAQFLEFAHAVDATIDAAYLRAGQCKAKVDDGTLINEAGVIDYWHNTLGGPLPPPE